MSIFDFFRRKAKRYATVITLIGFLTLQAEKAFAKISGEDPDYTKFKALSAQVERDLSKGTPNDGNLKELVRTLAKLKKRHIFFKGINVPLNLTGAVDDLSDFYNKLEFERSNLKKLDQGILFFRVSLDYILEMMKMLQDAERDIGQQLEEEKEQLKDYVRDLVTRVKKHSDNIKPFIEVEEIVKLNHIECFIKCGDLKGISCGFASAIDRMPLFDK